MTGGRPLSSRGRVILPTRVLYIHKTCCVGVYVPKCLLLCSFFLTDAPTFLYTQEQIRSQSTNRNGEIMLKPAGFPVDTHVRSQRHAADIALKGSKEYSDLGHAIRRKG